MARYRIAVGREQGVLPKNIVGAIANEADMDSRYIGRIDLYDNYSTVDLPAGMPPELLAHLRRARIGKFMLEIAPLVEGGAQAMEPRAYERSTRVDDHAPRRELTGGDRPMPSDRPERAGRAERVGEVAERAPRPTRAGTSAPRGDFGPPQRPSATRGKIRTAQSSRKPSSPPRPVTGGVVGEARAPRPEIRLGERKLRPSAGTQARDDTRKKQTWSKKSKFKRD